MWWKLYFWFYLVISIFSLIGSGALFSEHDSRFPILSLAISMVYQVVSVYGTWRYVYRGGDVHPRRWFGVLCVLTFFWGISLLGFVIPAFGSFLYPVIGDVASVGVGNLVVALFLDVPSLYCIFLLSRSKSSR
jgi:hypothetical protein